MSKLTTNRIIFLLIAFFGFLGLLSSLILTIEKIQVLENKDLLINCAINASVNCKSVMQAPQASLLGTPNSIFGIAGYAAVMALAVISLFVLVKNKTFWLLYFLGCFGAFVFSYWLLYQSIFVINSLCPFCLISCFSATNIFILSTLFMVKENFFPFLPEFNWSKRGSMAISGTIAFTILWYVFNFALAYSVFGSVLFG